MLHVYTKTIWRYQADTASWFFVSFSRDEVADILGHTIPTQRGWGQIPVLVTIGETNWQTTIFPSKKRGFDLPIKASVRKAEHIREGDSIKLSCTHA